LKINLGTAIGAALGAAIGAARLLIIAAAVGLGLSCQTSVDPLNPELSSRELFQRAIEASDSGNYRLALRYYAAFQERFPEDVPGNLWAKYEIAFIHYKMSEKEMALELLERLLERYEQEGAEGVSILPQAPRILAEKLVAQITEEG
jgi:outer membrane protein assembly factor BamD (BamD/ComL family)